ncbi:hypothetical protein OROMI_006409 [Orobanche minor]
MDGKYYTKRRRSQDSNSGYRTPLGDITNGTATMPPPFQQIKSTSPLLSCLTNVSTSQQREENLISKFRNRKQVFQDALELQSVRRNIMEDHLNSASVNENARTSNNAKMARMSRMEILTSKKKSAISVDITPVSNGGPLNLQINVARLEKQNLARIARKRRRDIVIAKKQANILGRVNRVDNTDYFDIGDPTYECEYCGALMWFEERSPKTSNSMKLIFTLCCSKGKVQLPLLKYPPKLLLDLLEKRHTKSKNFIEHIRKYNMMFSFTSMGGTIDKSVNSGRGPYTFRLGGQNHHRIGSLLPLQGSSPKFSQLYIHDTDDEINNRMKAAGKGTTKEIDDSIVADLKKLVDDNNPYAQSFRMVTDRLHQGRCDDVRLRLIGRRSRDGRTYNLPTTSEVAALIVGDVDSSYDTRDVTVETQSGALQRINELHPSYLPLQYPLLFIYGEDGYYADVPHAESSNNKRINLTIREFTAYRIQDRVNEGSQILLGRKLFQQYLVDSYTMMETQRLDYIRFNQPALRVEKYRSLSDAVARGDTASSSMGKRIVLPSSFTGGARYMIQNFQDAMAICRWAGYPSFFITFTCNPKWQEITRFVNKRGLRPEDRPDILCRVFKIKLDQLVNDLKDNHIFGKPKAG